MTIQQLLENAHLDALGLLDAGEEAAFERAFAAAPAGVKAQVRAEQARWAEAASLLPDAHPSPELRQRVLDAVSAAMLERAAGSEAGLELKPAVRVARWWRMGAVSMACAAVLMGALAWTVNQKNSELSEQITNKEILEAAMTQRTGSKVLADTFLSANLQRVVFEPTAAAKDAKFEGHAAIHMHEGWESPRLYCGNFPANTGKIYKLVILTATNDVQSELNVLPGDMGLNTQAIEDDLAKGTRLAIISVTAGAAFNATQDILLTATI